MKTSIICFGELVVDCFGSMTNGFAPKFGGAPGNTSIGLKKLGISDVHLYATVGNDFFGDFLIHTLKEHGVQTEGVYRHPEKKTTLAFVALTPEGQRSFVFYEGAHPYPSSTIFNESVFAKSAVLHFGSLTQSTSEGQAATERALQLARAHGLLISYDPNVREALWKDLDALRTIIVNTIPRVDFLKINEEEALFLTGTSDPAKAANALWKDSLSLLIITRGAKGAWYKTRSFSGVVETITVDVLDTTGAGDACNAGLLYQIVASGKSFAELTEDEIRKCVRFAVVFASLSTTQKGAVEALPSQDEVQKYM